jgi:hypothetical protein
MIRENKIVLVSLSEGTTGAGEVKKMLQNEKIDTTHPYLHII